MKTKSILAAIVLIVSIVGSVWAVSSYWHNYRAIETIHEKTQSDAIHVAMNQSNLAIYQQRANWLEQRIWEMEKQYGCPQCTGSIKRTYKRYVQEYKSLRKKIERLTK